MCIRDRYKADRLGKFLLVHVAYTQEERLFFLRQLLFSDGSWIREYFLPQYKADRLGKFLLVHVGAGAFDAWMSLLTGIRFKYMFGARK